MKQLAKYTAVVVATLTSLTLMWQFRNALLLFLLSLFMAAAIRPIIDRLTKRGLSLPSAMFITYAIAVITAVLLVLLLRGSLVAEINTIANEAVLTYEQQHPRWVQGSPLQQTIASRLPTSKHIAEAITQQTDTLAQLVLGATTRLLTLLTGLVIVLVLSIYWSADRTRFERLWFSLLPASWRDPARRLWYAVEEGVGAYLRSELLQAMLAALLLSIGFWLIGLKWPLIVAGVGAIAWMIPIIGFVFVAIPAFLVGLASSPLHAVAAVSYTLVVLFVLERKVEPRFFPRQQYSSILIIISLLVMADVMGVVGLVVAPPLAVALQIGISFLFTSLVAPRRTTNETAELNERLQELHHTLSQNEQPSLEIENIVSRLTQLIQQADELSVNPN